MMYINIICYLPSGVLECQQCLSMYDTPNISQGFNSSPQYLTHSAQFLSETRYFINNGFISGTKCWYLFQAPTTELMSIKMF